jgi:hypothetical protein
LVSTNFLKPATALSFVGFLFPSLSGLHRGQPVVCVEFSVGSGRLILLGLAVSSIPLDST